MSIVYTAVVLSFVKKFGMPTFIRFIVISRLEPNLIHEQEFVNACSVQVV